MNYVKDCQACWYQENMTGKAAQGTKASERLLPITVGIDYAHGKDRTAVCFKLDNEVQFLYGAIAEDVYCMLSGEITKRGMSTTPQTQGGLGEENIIKIIDRWLMDNGKTVYYSVDNAIVQVDPFYAAVGIARALSNPTPEEKK
jgi:hypothetical protein